jgi:ankyrin repeat protein
MDLLQYLATKGADVEAEDPQGRMPLHHAGARAQTSGSLVFANRLCVLLFALQDCVVNVLLVMPVREMHHVALPAYAALTPSKMSGSFLPSTVVSGSIEVLRFLIQRSTWLDAADGADDTALHLAARCGLLAAVWLCWCH